MTPSTFSCKNIHNFDEKPSPDPKLCLHCWFLKINKELEKLYNTVDIPCQCGCKDVCPECDGERYCDYGRGEDESIEGCQVCNEDGHMYDPNEDDAYDVWRDTHDD